MYDLIVTITKKKNIFGSRQKYRFRISSGRNFKILAVSNDAYVNEEDLEDALDLILGPLTGRSIHFKYDY